MPQTMITTPTFSLERIAWDDPRAAALRERMERELDALYADDDEDDAGEIDAIFEVRADRILATFLATVDGEPAGHAALLRYVDPDSGIADEGTVELRKLVVDSRFRRRGIASGLLDAVEDAARAAGARRIVLDTGDRQLPAIAGYERAGYRRIPPFPPYDRVPRAVCFEKPL